MRGGIHRLVIAVVAVIACLALAPTAHSQSCITNAQVTLSGNLRSANGLPASNYILTLTPTQQGYISDCGINLALSNICATSTDGSVVGLQNPLTSTINTTSGSGSLPSGVYYTVYAWYDAVGHITLISPETRTTLSATGSLVVNPPASGVPAVAVGMDVYISTSSGAETLQGQTTGTASFVQSTALTTGASPSTTNTTLCQIVSNDSVWPTGTGYNVNLTDSLGNPIPNYPMQWQLIGAGTTISLSNGLPYYHGVVFYPAPILAQPANHGTQSISGGLSFGNNFLYSVGRIGLNTNTPAWGVDAEGSGAGGTVNAEQGFLINGNGGTAGQCIQSDGTYFDTPGACQVLGGTPTFSSLGPGAGTGAAVTLAAGSTDSSGVIQLTTGTTPSANAEVVLFNFSKTYTFAFCVVSPLNLFSNAYSVIGGSSAPTQFGLTAINNGIPLTASTSGYNYTYHCDIR
jgi:hypothetical protein